MESTIKNVSNLPPELQEYILEYVEPHHIQLGYETWLKNIKLVNKKYHSCFYASFINIFDDEEFESVCYKNKGDYNFRVWHGRAICVFHGINKDTTGTCQGCTMMYINNPIKGKFKQMRLPINY